MIFLENMWTTGVMHFQMAGLGTMGFRLKAIQLLNTKDATIVSIE